MPTPCSKALILHAFAIMATVLIMGCRRQPGLPPEDLHPGVAVQLIPGAVIDLGDGVTVQVLDP